MTKRSYPTPVTGDCDHCARLATLDFGKAVQVPGLPGKTRRVCCHHGRGLRGHRGCTACATPPACTRCGADADVITNGGDPRCRLHQPLDGSSTPLYELRSDFPDVASYVAEIRATA